MGLLSRGRLLSSGARDIFAGAYLQSQVQSLWPRLTHRCPCGEHLGAIDTVARAPSLLG